MYRKLNCDFCGQPIQNPTTGERLCFVEGKKHASKNIESVIICERCLKKTHDMLFNGQGSIGNKSSNKRETVSTWSPADAGNSFPDLKKIPNPSEIFEHLRKRIEGQDDYLRQLSVFGYEHMSRMRYLTGNEIPPSTVADKKNLFVIGPTGSGKTFGMELLADYLRIPFVIIDATTLTAEGYVGQDVSDIAQLLISKSGDNIKRASFGIIAIDEVDKIASSGQSGSLDIGGHGVQTCLLKLIESSRHSNIQIPKNKYKKNMSTKTFDASNVSFVAMGAFSGLKNILSAQKCRIGFNHSQSHEEREEIAYRISAEEDVDAALVKYGMLPEFMARFTGGRSILKPLGVKELKSILLNEKGSIMNEINNFEREGVTLEITDLAATALARKAFEQRRGARALFFQFNELAMNLKFEHFGKETVHRHIKIGTNRQGDIKITAVKSRQRKQLEVQAS